MRTDQFKAPRSSIGWRYLIRELADRIMDSCVEVCELLRGKKMVAVEAIGEIVV
jgi:hypothetical protein